MHAQPFYMQYIRYISLINVLLEIQSIFFYVSMFRTVSSHFRTVSSHLRTVSSHLRTVSSATRRWELCLKTVSSHFRYQAGLLYARLPLQCKGALILPRTLYPWSFCHTRPKLIEGENGKGQIKVSEWRIFPIS